MLSLSRLLHLDSDSGSALLLRPVLHHHLLKYPAAFSLHANCLIVICFEVTGSAVRSAAGTGRGKGSSVTLDEIDKELADWKTKLQLASDNLLALTQLITYERLAGEAGWPRVQLTGATEARVVPALAAMRELWSHYSLLTDLVTRATELRDWDWAQPRW
jgi:hypothetical protein